MAFNSLFGLGTGSGPGTPRSESPRGTFKAAKGVSEPPTADGGNLGFKLGKGGWSLWPGNKPAATRERPLRLTERIFCFAYGEESPQMSTSACHCIER